LAQCIPLYNEYIYVNKNGKKKDAYSEENTWKNVSSGHIKIVYKEKYLSQRWKPDSTGASGRTHPLFKG
jgi:hypothetical protein